MIDLLEHATPQCLSPLGTRDDSPIPVSPILPRNGRTRLTTRMITKLAECRHFHFAYVELGPIELRLMTIDADLWTIQVSSDQKEWLILRSWTEIVEFDQQLHRCVFERRHSKLAELGLCDDEPPSSSSDQQLSSQRRTLIEVYLERLSRLTGSLITCYPVLKFLEVDSRGGHFSPPEMSAINTPAIAAAVVTKDFQAVTPEQLTIQVGDIISIIEMCSRVHSETTWWKAKLTISAAKNGKNGGDENKNTFRIGFFPSNCVQLFEDKGLQISPPSSHKHFSAARRVSEIFRRGVRKRNAIFGTDLDVHLTRSGRKVPLILERCVSAIEKHGIVTGIYRQCGIQSNIQRLRAKFDTGADPNLCEFGITRDVYCVSSLLKQYFRQLPNPLFTYELYDRLLTAHEGSSEEEKVSRLKEVLEELPFSHYNTARYLMRHLSRMCEHTNHTDMTSRNLAIVWAPNLFRAPPPVEGHDAHLLSGLNVHTSLCNFLIVHTSEVFRDPTLDAEEEDATKSLASNITASPALGNRHQSVDCGIDKYEGGTKRSYDFRWSRAFRGKSVDGLNNGGNRRRTINGGEDRRRRRKDTEEDQGPEESQPDIKWRRAQSTDTFRPARSESIISILTKGYDGLRDGMRSLGKRAYSLRPGSRPPASPQLFATRRFNGDMTESVTVSTISRVSTSDALEARMRNTEIKEESPCSSCSGSVKDFMTAKEKRVAFRSVVHDVPLCERSSPVEEWSSESRNSPLLEMSRYDNVSPARPREHVIDRSIVAFGLPPTAESPLPDEEVFFNRDMSESVASDNRDLFSIP